MQRVATAVAERVALDMAVERAVAVRSRLGAREGAAAEEAPVAAWTEVAEAAAWTEVAEATAREGWVKERVLIEAEGMMEQATKGLVVSWPALLWAPGG